MSDETQREMTLQEWCDRLPKIHLVNTELSALRQQVAELDARLSAYREALEKILDNNRHCNPRDAADIARQALAGDTKTE
jgi:hypothetical protein